MTSVMVTGSRDWPNKWMIESFLIEYLNKISPPSDTDKLLGDKPITLMNGGATGVDEFARSFWERRNIGNIITYTPDWAHDGADAPLRRNITMLNQDPDHVIIFIYNNSASSEYAAGLARKRGLNVTRVTIEEYL